MKTTNISAIGAYIIAQMSTVETSRKYTRCNYICANTFYSGKQEKEQPLDMDRSWWRHGKQIDYFHIGGKHRNWITNINSKHIANPRLSKQHKILHAHFQIKLKNNPNTNNNKLPYCVNSLRDNPGPLSNDELKIIISRMNFDDDNWRNNGSGK